MQIVKLVAILDKNGVRFMKHNWELISEKNAYYEINAGGQYGRLSNKRLKKEMLNVVEADQGNHLGHQIGYSAFCTEDKIEEMQQRMVALYKERMIYFAKALEEAQNAVDNMSLEINVLV